MTPALGYSCALFCICSFFSHHLRAPALYRPQTSGAWSPGRRLPHALINLFIPFFCKLHFINWVTLWWTDRRRAYGQQKGLNLWRAQENAGQDCRSHTVWTVEGQSSRMRDKPTKNARLHIKSFRGISTDGNNSWELPRVDSVRESARGSSHELIPFVGRLTIGINSWELPRPNSVRGRSHEKESIQSKRFHR